jgi:hypothetical protein
MKDTRHPTILYGCLGSTLAYISPGTSAHWDERLYSHSGLFLLTKTLPEFFGVLSVRHNRYLMRGARKLCEKSWNS